ncbi:unnamed protein product [Ixodes hexagonus]
MLRKLFKLSEGTNCEDDTSFLVAELRSFPMMKLRTRRLPNFQPGGGGLTNFCGAVGGCGGGGCSLVPNSIVYYVGGSLMKSFFVSTSRQTKALDRFKVHTSSTAC